MLASPQSIICIMVTLAGLVQESIFSQGEPMNFDPPKEQLLHWDHQRGWAGW